MINWFEVLPQLHAQERIYFDPELDDFHCQIDDEDTSGLICDDCPAVKKINGKTICSFYGELGRIHRLRPTLEKHHPELFI